MIFKAIIHLKINIKNKLNENYVLLYFISGIMNK